MKPLVGGVSHKIVILVMTLTFTLIMSASAFADVTITKDWDDNLSGTSASARSAPSVSLEGTTSYEKLLNLMYPVGCYFETSDTSFNPNSAWGGTWEEDTSGRVLVGDGTNDGVTYTAGETGGEATHTLTINEMPSHSHNLWVEYGSSSNLNSAVPGQYNSVNFTYHIDSYNRSGAVLDTGGSQAHNNMQPYKVVKRWHRIA